MKIAHVTATFPPYWGGTGNVAYYNARELARRGHEVHIFTTLFHGTSDCERIDGFTVHRLHPLIRYGNAALLPGLLRLRRFDLVHLHFPFYFGAEIVTVAARLRHMPLIITYHQDVRLAGNMNLVAALHDHTLGVCALRSAVLVLFTSLDYGKASKARWLFASRPNCVDELPNGVDCDRFYPNRSGISIRQKYGFSAGDIILILVANLDRAHYFKGVEILLRILGMMKRTDVKLLIVGDGDLRKDYEKTAVEQGVADRVFFIGRVSDEQLPIYYAASDIGILPSWTMGEAFGIVLLEAMACGKPVISSNLPGVRTVVSDGEDGLLAKPGDIADLKEKIQTLIDNPQLRQEMGQRGRAKVEEKYAWPKIGEKLESFYRSVLSDSQCGGKQ